MIKIKYVLAVILFTFFMLPTTGYSQETKSEVYKINYKNQQYTSFTVDTFWDSLSEKDKESLLNLSNKMAGIFVISKTLGGTDVVHEVNGYISDFLKLDSDKDNTKEIISFWNTYSKYLICSTEYDFGRTPIHVLKRAVETNNQSEMFFKYLMKFGPGVIDFNAVEIVDGEEETLIDYIDKIIASENFHKNYTTYEVKTLRGGLVKHFNAKKASELKK